MEFDSNETERVSELKGVALWQGLWTTLLWVTTLYLSFTIL